MSYKYKDKRLYRKFHRFLDSGKTFSVKTWLSTHFWIEPWYSDYLIHHKLMVVRFDRVVLGGFEKVEGFPYLDVKLYYKGVMIARLSDDWNNGLDIEEFELEE